ncbi:MAG: CoA activase, partial [Armatimonadetes bacterium]|nr:CoA activase [Armatimonadota bacterium]
LKNLLKKINLNPKKFLTIEVDEHNADAGIITRCEAFLDSLKNIKAKSSLNKQKIDFNFKKDERTLFIPNMCDHAYALESAFLACGVKAEVVPPSNQETLSLGRKYTLGKECYPAIITTGDMLKVIKNNDPEKIAFFMPTAGGGCRFGYYHKLHSLILEELNLKIPIFAPSQNDNFYKDFGLSGSNFIYLAYLGILAIDLLDKALRETRPYEKEKGETEKKYKIFLEKIKQGILNKENLLPVMKEARYVFEKIKVPSLKVKIGIVGEIFVRSHSFSNENLVKKLENLGAEVHLPPIFEWLFYLNYLRKKEYLKNKNYLKFMKNLIEEKIQIYEEERLSRAWEGYLNLPEPTAGENINSGSLYLDPSFEGEAILSLGKAGDYIKKGISGIINVMPFTCMPGTIVNGMLKKFKIDHQNIPTLNLAYDGSEQSQTEIKLEAFIYQAKNYLKN